MDVGIFTGFEAPFLLARLRVKRVQIAVPATDVDGIVRNRRRGMDDVTGSKLPLQNSSDSIYTVNISVAAADINSRLPAKMCRCPMNQEWFGSQTDSRAVVCLRTVARIRLQRSIS